MLFRTLLAFRNTWASMENQLASTISIAARFTLLHLMRGKVFFGSSSKNLLTERTFPVTSPMNFKQNAAFRLKKFAILLKGPRIVLEQMIF